MGIVSRSQGGGAIASVTVTLTDAQIKALPTSTAVLVAAPGVGRLLRFLYGTISKNFTGGAYANNGVTGMYFVYDTVSEFDPASDTLGDTDTDFWLTNTTVRQMDFPPRTGPTAVPFPSGADLRNTNLGFTIDNSLGAFTGGNAANSLTVAAFYVVIAL